MHYFDITQTGRSQWWAWIAGFWIALLIWVVAQTILMAPILMIGAVADPDLASAIETSMKPPSAKAATHATAMLMLGALLSLIGIVLGFTLKAPFNKVFGGLAGVGIIMTIYYTRIANAGGDNAAMMELINSAMGSSPWAYGLFLLTFPAGLGGLYLSQKLIHKRPIRSLYTSASHMRWGRLLQGVGITWGVLATFTCLGVALGLMEIKNIFSNDSRFWVYAAVSLCLIPLQSATEEIVFRGYLNQGLTHLLKNKWVAFTLTSLGFMALHLSNPEALSSDPNAVPIVMSGYFLFGFAACLLVWIDDGLETAIGVHAANNCFAAIFVNYENSVLPTPSIWLASGSNPVTDTVTTIVVLIAIVGIVWWLRGGPARSSGIPSSLDA